MLSGEETDDRYLLIYKEILEGLNLEQHWTDVNRAISQIDDIINENDTDPLPLELWYQIRSELHGLRNEILKRL